MLWRMDLWLFVVNWFNWLYWLILVIYLVIFIYIYIYNPIFDLQMTLTVTCWWKKTSEKPSIEFHTYSCCLFNFLFHTVVHTFWLLHLEVSSLTSVLFTVWHVLNEAYIPVTCEAEFKAKPTFNEFSIFSPYVLSAVSCFRQFHKSSPTMSIVSSVSLDWMSRCHSFQGDN